MKTYIRPELAVIDCAIEGALMSASGTTRTGKANGDNPRPRKAARTRTGARRISI